MDNRYPTVNGQYEYPFILNLENEVNKIEISEKDSHKTAFNL